MAASHYGLWYEGKPTNIGRDTAADQWGELMMRTYQKITGKTRQESTGEEFWGNRRQQRSNMTMAASHRGFWYEGKLTNIGHVTAAD